MLHLGTYKVVEQQAPDSLTIGKTEEERTHMVTLSYAGQTVEVVEEETQYENARPKISVEVLKKSSNDDAALKGGKFLVCMQMKMLPVQMVLCWLQREV